MSEKMGTGLCKTVGPGARRTDLTLVALLGALYPMMEASVAWGAAVIALGTRWTVQERAEIIPATRIIVDETAKVAPVAQTVQAVLADTRAGEVLEMAVVRASATTAPTMVADVRSLVEGMAAAMLMEDVAMTRGVVMMGADVAAAAAVEMEVDRRFGTDCTRNREGHHCWQRAECRLHGQRPPLQLGLPPRRLLLDQRAVPSASSLQILVAAA